MNIKNVIDIINLNWMSDDQKILISILELNVSQSIGNNPTEKDLVNYTNYFLTKAIIESKIITPKICCIYSAAAICVISLYAREEYELDGNEANMGTSLETLPWGKDFFIPKKDLLTLFLNSLEDDCKLNILNSKY